MANYHSNFQDGFHHPGGLFASVGQGLGVSSNPRADGGGGGGGMKLSYTDFYMKFMEGIRRFGGQEEDGLTKKKKKNKLKIKVSNPSLQRLISGAIAGAVSRTAVAPLETIRTHLMVGTSGHSTTEVFNDIMKTDWWKGLFRGEQAKHPIPPSLIAGACAGVSSTLCTYPLELLKTRLTIQRGVYDGLFDAFLKILREEGPAELYRGLAPSLIGVIPYAATNYFAYDSLRKAYRNFLKQDNKIGNIETLLIGSAAGAISSNANFPS
ncbi:adenine nucleotide transporter BT1, chloroplastic/mitochondrial-like [Cannabis sativa]|uniref:adenine nucleotide transporter BT1, chloroplastic/mitochondrial-like n=1 Tax=Cannabis sativa TaxID=3483 RepID=UPI0029CAA223|nr:adenine nucleotide transporter BT1, chloroplastic/mitochondrial-like [Cannabis sativa]